jgi:hypothetical protein
MESPLLDAKLLAELQPLAPLVPLVLLVLTILHVLLRYSVWRTSGSAQVPRKVLLVTAHPDDEAMFFVPTITALRASDADVVLLCLSTGG